MGKSNRCEFRHDGFLHTDFDKTFGSDGTNQCWMTETQLYNHKFYCYFHAPTTALTSHSITTLKAQTFKKVINLWNSQYKKTIFRMPGLNYNGLTFEGITFHKPISFSGAIFHGEALFEGATFNDNALFEGVIFNEYANFKDTQFHGSAIFQGVIFNDHADFKDTQFHDSTLFDGVIFNGYADFKDARFNGDADFQEVKFHSLADFRGGVFSGFTVFPDAIFFWYAEFIDAKFNDHITFNRASFKDNLNFDQANFKSGPNFQNVSFTKAPSFHDSTLSSSADFRGATFNDTSSRDAPPNYRALKLEMNKVSNKHQEAIFYGLEQKSLRHQPDRDFGKSIVSWLYEKSSNYGQSFMRPLSWLISLVPLFSLIYSCTFYPISKLPAYISLGMPNFWEKLTPMVSFTIKNIVSPFKVWTKKDPVFTSSTSLFELSVSLLATVQSIICLTLITLFILAIRRAYKMG